MGLPSLMSYRDGGAVVACRLMRVCELCDGTGRQLVAEWGINEPCWGCGGDGGQSLVDRLRVWNRTNPRGSFPARFWCWIFRHDWESMEGLEYCTRCRALWELAWEETAAPERF